MKFTQLLTCNLFAIITAGAFAQQAQQAQKPHEAKEPWEDLEDTNRKDPRFVEKTVAYMDLVYAKNGEREMLLNLYHPKDQ